MKIAIVTGANTGLGYETALGLAKEGYKVIMGCRTAAKAQTAMDKIKRSVSNAGLEFIQLDLVDRPSIKAFAETFSSKYDHLDVLVNNAGVMVPPYTITQNNLELQLDANHMGHFYLTHLLMGVLDQEFETRVVNVSSLAGKNPHSDIYFDNLNFEGNYDEGPSMMGQTGMVAYCQSKFANILFTLELKDRLEASGKNIKAVVAHPGMANTDLSRSFPWWLRMLVPILAPMMGLASAADGAQSQLLAATGPDVQAGEFYGPTGNGERSGPPGKVKLPDNAFDDALRDKFWELSESELGIQFKI